MNIVPPSAHIHSIDGSEPTRNSGIQALMRIEWIGRISHRSEDAQTEDSWKRFIDAVVLGHGDWSIVEHVHTSVDMNHDRGFQQEITRHRIGSFVEGSYTIESTRFVNYAKRQEPSFVYPRNYKDENPDPDWLEAINFAEMKYQKLVAKGWLPQEARSVFPLALCGRIIHTENLRSWRHLFLMRTTKETHAQFREVSIPLLAEFQKAIPLLYDDIEPLQRQIDNLRLPR